MISPTFSPVGEGSKIHPIYKQTAGLNSKIIANAVKQALSYLLKGKRPVARKRTKHICSV